MIVHGNGERFQVSAVTGYSIGPHGGSHGKQSTSYAVLDAHYCYQPVETYAPRRPDRDARTRHKAFSLCDHLNAVHAGTYAESLRHWNGTLACTGCGQRVAVSAAVIGSETALCPRCAESS